MVTTDFEELVRDSMQQFAAGIRLPGGLASRARRRHRRRRFAQCTAIVAVTAVAGAAAVTGAGAVARTAPPSAAVGRNAGHLHALTTSYVVQRVSDALANDHLVMRETNPASEGRQPNSFEGRQTSQYVGWYYQGHASLTLYDINSQPLWKQGTGFVDGKLLAVEVDYIPRVWYLLGGGYLGTPPPASACGKNDFLSATALGVDWPSVIRSSLACGAYQADGYVYIGTAKAVKVTASGTMNFPGGRSVTIATTLYVDPVSFLPVQIMQFSGSPGHAPRLIETVDFQWLKPTPANAAQALVTIPAGFPQVRG